MERTISITGKGRISLKPDLIRLIMRLEGTFEDYGETLKQSSQQMEALKNMFEGLGFERGDIKTLSFNIDAEYQSDKSWKKRFIGYKFRHSFKLEFDIDNARLGKILYALAHEKTCPEFHIFYTIKDDEAAKDELLKNALKDSMKKAELLSAASGVTLGEIININYLFEDVKFLSVTTERLFDASCMRAAGAAEDAAYDVNVEPDNIELTDTVTVIWSIV